MRVEHFRFRDFLDTETWIFLFCSRIGENSSRGFCTFTCFSAKEMFSEELKNVPRDGVSNQAVDVEKE